MQMTMSYTKLQSVRRDHSMNFLRGLHDEMLDAVEQLKQSKAEILRCLQRVEDHLVYRLLGYGSLFTYASEGLRMPKGQAYNFITVARKARDLPALFTAIESGEMTVTKARKVTAVINDENQEQWIELCKTASTREIERAVAKINPKAAVQEKARFVSESELELTLAASEKTHALLKRAQDVLSQKNKSAASMNETLAAALELYLEKTDPVRKAQRAVTKDARTVDDQDTAGGLTDGRHRNRWIGSQLNLVEEKSTDRQTSRKRSKPAAVFHRVRLRDQGRCQMRLPNGEQCGDSRWVDIHHIVAHAHGGREQLENLVILCHGHHQLQH